MTSGARSVTFIVRPTPDDRWTVTGRCPMTNCPTCGLALAGAAARCPLCNERLVRVHLGARHLLSALLAIEICVALIVLT